MQKQFALVCLLLATIGCGGSESFDERAARISQFQSEGIDGATVVVKRAYEYSGDSYHEDASGKKLIAVDLQFLNPNAGLDLDDVEVIDGATDDNFGSFPDIYLLTSAGEMADQSKWPRARPDELRVLLVYQVPTELQSIQLRYWGRDVTAAPVAIQGTGPMFKDDSN